MVFPISDLKDTKSEELSFQGANFLLYIPQTSAKFTGKLLDFLALEVLGLFFVVDHLENANNDNLYAVHMYYYRFQISVPLVWEPVP